MLQGCDVYRVAQLCSHDFNVCNSFHPVLASQLLHAKSLMSCLCPHIRYTKGVQLIFIWRLSMDISHAIMLGVSCYATSSCEKQLALREASLSFFKPMFSPWAAGWRVVCCVPTFFIYLFYMSLSSPTPFHILGTNLPVGRCENLKK